jgi:hypothetical protein
MIKEEFYTEKRWLNWMNKVKESKFSLPDGDEKATGGAVFVYIMDDVILACLKVIARWERKVLPTEEAIAEIDSIRKIVYEEHESLGEDADLMIDSLKTSLAAVFVSAQRFIEGNYDKESPLPEMIKAAVDSESQENIDEAFDILSQVGARVIGGETVPEEVLAEMQYSLTAELLDGIDAISAALLGDNSYKEDDGTACEEEL